MGCRNVRLFVRVGQRYAASWRDGNVGRRGSRGGRGSSGGRRGRSSTGPQVLRGPQIVQADIRLQGGLQPEGHAQDLGQIRETFRVWSAGHGASGLSLEIVPCMFHKYRRLPEHDDVEIEPSMLRP